jgi:hypothetical protein
MDNIEETPSDITKQISVISRYEMLLMLENWLEWQKICGTDYGKIDDTSLLRMNLKRASKPSISDISKNNLSAVVSSNTSSKFTKNVRERQSIHAKQQGQSPSLKSKIQEGNKQEYNKQEYNKQEYNKQVEVLRTTVQQRSQLRGQSLNTDWSRASKIKDYIDFNQYSPSPNSLEQVDIWVKNNCSTNSGNTVSCVSAKGNWNADVLLIEGHSQSLSPEGLDMLKKMREHVLLINASQFFWLPFPRGKGCGGCKAVFKAKLNSVQPKMVLWMGTELSQYLNFEGAIPKLGQSGKIKMAHGTIPIFRSYHPMSLLEQPTLKNQAHHQLKQFHQLLLQRKIVPRENLARYKQRKSN